MTSPTPPPLAALLCLQKYTTKPAGGTEKDDWGRLPIPHEEPLNLATSIDKSGLSIFKVDLYPALHSGNSTWGRAGSRSTPPPSTHQT